MTENTDSGMQWPFQCENCGHKPTPQDVVKHGGECEKCKDVVVAYTVDTAEVLLAMMAARGEKSLDNEASPC